MESPAAYRLWQAPFAERKFAPVRTNNDLGRVSRVLDLGCGPGTNTRHFGASDYLGVDVNPRYVSYARQRHGREFVHADATDYVPLDGKRWDFVLVNSFLHHLPSTEVARLLSHARGLVAEDGHVHILELVRPVGASLAGALARADRGRYARPLGRWRELFEESFHSVVLDPYRLGGLGITLWNMVYFKGTPRR
jgi:SAM-dependent methyltransferase